MKECENPDPEWSLETADPEYLATLTSDEWDTDAIREWRESGDEHIVFDAKKVAREMELNRGDVFTVNNLAFEVVSTDFRMSPSDRDSLTVTDPTVTNPQHARYGNWGTAMLPIFKDWKRGEAVPGRLTVT